MTDEIKNDADSRMKKSITSLENEYNAFRTGRASASLFENIKVDYYGTATPLNQVATISIPEARLVVIQPWDKGVLSEIEKAIQKSELGLNPNNDGKLIRLNIPPLTEQRRVELVKVAKSTAENSKVSIRNIRRDAIEQLKKAQKDSSITEDELKKGEDDIQKLTDKFVLEITKIFEAKEKEIMEV